MASEVCGAVTMWSLDNAKIILKMPYRALRFNATFDINVSSYCFNPVLSSEAAHCALYGNKKKYVYFSDIS